MSGLILREAKNTNELEQLLRLKYEQYAKGKQYAFQQENKYGIDLDPSYRNSVHYGLFEKSNGCIAAYLRVIYKELSYQSSWIDQLICKYDSDLFGMALSPPLVCYPLLSYYPEADRILNPILIAVTKQNKNIFSVSMLTIHEDFRSPSVVSRLIDSVFTILVKIVDQCIITCLPNHLNFYTSIGFELLDGPRDIPSQSINLSINQSINQSLLLLLRAENYKRNNSKETVTFMQETI